MIVRHYREHHLNFAKIASHIPGRSETMIKNRYYSFINKKDRLKSFLNEVEGAANGDLP